jgi:23S rRNA pseudouridine1911/1915/1917 synthase
MSANPEDNYEIIELEIPNDIAKERLDKYIGRIEKPHITRSRFQKLAESGLVTVNGKIVKRNFAITGGEKITIKIPPSPPSEVQPQNIPLDILYEDDSLLVINKPAGMVTHPGAGNRDGTLVNALLYYSKELSSVQGWDRPGIVHRLDKNTTGLIIIAKNDTVHLALQNQLKERQIKKIYYALICGHMKKEKDLIEMPVGRSLKDRKKMTVTNVKGRVAITEYELLERFKLYDLLKINIKTGRTHQIRVHFSFLGHPVFGDAEYGGRLKWHRGVFSVDKKTAQKALEMMPRQALHAKSLEFTHPVSGKVISIDSDLPEDFASLLEFLEAEGR